MRYVWLALAVVLGFLGLGAVLAAAEDPFNLAFAIILLAGSLARVRQFCKPRA